MSIVPNNVYQLIEDSVLNYPDNIALNVAGESYSYSKLDVLANQVAFFLEQTKEINVGLLASRSLTGYLGIWASLKAKKTYVPINSLQPTKKKNRTIELANIRILIIDNKNIQNLIELHKEGPREFLLIFPETCGSDIPVEIKNNYKVITSEDLSRIKPKQNEVSSISLSQGSDLVYILFTSGTTGEPKGVPISHTNILAYLENFNRRFEITPQDRLVQTADISFDLSVHDIFLSWANGAALFCVPQKNIFAPGKFIVDNKISMWCSVPAVIRMMSQLKLLRSNVFPDLRYSMFCGEALTTDAVVQWKKAAPNSVIENTYGPTEATVNISSYRIPENLEEIAAKDNIVSIGNIFPNQEYVILNEKDKVVENKGELCLFGTQVIGEYWNGEEGTRQSFIKLKQSGKIYYRTGDFVLKEKNLLFYLGRKDFQVKLNGFRVEIGEINLVLSKLFSVEDVITLPIRNPEGITEGLVSFIVGEPSLAAKIHRSEIRQLLPEHMIPKELIFINEVPLNRNGKVDFMELRKLIK